MKVKPLVIAIGQAFRQDDGLGPAVLQQLKNQRPNDFDFIEHNGDPSNLIECWQGREVLLLDAVQTSGAKPGTVYRLRPLQDKLAEQRPPVSSHAASLSEALLLGQALNRMPHELTLYAVEAQSMRLGRGLSPTVAAAVPKLLALICQDHAIPEQNHA